MSVYGGAPGPLSQDRLQDFSSEWSTWQSTDPDSPGRIDASCIPVYGLIPEANQGAIVHAPRPRSPTGRPGGAASA
ncbi:hypothetical protein [Streptomyces sp. 1222.5]|uniref:hypothetical protein n=1 Tax=Streptomyces sp. 1222.5 TaxID=1881026 RepID=UPI003D718C56